MSIPNEIISNLAFVKEKFMGVMHNYTYNEFQDDKALQNIDSDVDDIVYNLSCQILASYALVATLDKENVDTVKEANIEVRRQNCNTLPFCCNHVIPIPNDIIEVNIFDNDIRSYITENSDYEVEKGKPIRAKVQDVDYVNKTITIGKGLYISMRSYKIVEVADLEE